MSGLEGVYGEDGRWWAIARNLLVLAGSLIAAVGFVAVAASLVAGFGFGKADALTVAALLGGTLLLGSFLACSVCTLGAGAGRSRVLAGLGTVVGFAGLVLFWTSLPTDWTGNLARLPEVALGTYAVGLLVVFWAGLGAGSATSEEPGAELAGPGVESAGPSAESTDADSGASPDLSGSEHGVEETSSLGGVESAVRATAEEAHVERAHRSSTVGDGGEEEDDLTFFDGDDES